MIRFAPILLLLACSPAATTEATYTAELLRCVDKSETITESRSCRAAVDVKFGVAKDGGK